MAVAGKMAEARFNTPEHAIFSHHVICLAGDGCLQGGVSAEASSYAGHNHLDNLILIYDSNDVTLDAMAVKTQSEDTAMRYQAYGWDVVTVDGHDLAALASAIAHAKADDNGKPKLIIAKTIIGRGIPEVAGTSAGHGEGGAKFAESARIGLGLPGDKTFTVTDTVKEFFAAHKKVLIAAYSQWEKTYEAWSDANPALDDLLAAGARARSGRRGHRVRLGRRM